MAKDDDLLRGAVDQARMDRDPTSLELTPQRMEALGRLAAGISHDFKNLLTAILGNCHLMLEDEVVEARVGDVLRETLEAAGAGAEIVSQLMRFSSPSGSADLTADVVPVVDRLVELLKRFVGEDIRIQRTVARGPMRVRLDAGRIEQIILNLIFNAREAMPGGGELRLSVSQVHIAAVGSLGSRLRSDVMGRPIPPGDYVVISVADDGVGIAPEVKARIFEPFFTTKETIDGARGLGLSTVYGIVTGAGGWIGLRSEQRKGTTVTVYVPLASDDQVLDLREHPDSMTDGE